jgi:hypothetical protein
MAPVSDPHAVFRLAASGFPSAKVIISPLKKKYFPIEIIPVTREDVGLPMKG